MSEKIDPITLEIIQAGLQATADEMFAVMKRTAMSSIIYEVLDMGTAVTDARGALASSGAGIPAFVGVLDKSVQTLLRKFNKPEDIRPGDVFTTNDPYHGGVTHLNDIVVAMPVFIDDRIVAWTANIAHHPDVGGMRAGSMSSEVTEIYQEGLRLPAVKMISEGEPIDAVFDIIRTNSRMPDVVQGDLWAGIASVRIGAARLAELARRYGPAVFEQAMQDYMDIGEQVALAELRKLPHGTFEFSEEQDDGRVFNVKLTLTPEEFVVDLTKNPDQEEGPSNASRDGAIICAQVILGAFADASMPCNDGTFRPLRLITRPGSVFDAVEPAALGFYFEVEIRLFDLIWRCLAQHMPDRLPAGHFGSICGTFISGKHPDTGRQFTVVEPQPGGWGAGHERDGNSAIFCGFHGETYNCPVEITEARNGLLVDRLELNVGRGGEGRWAGGRGVHVDYRIRRDGFRLTTGYTRSRILPWGLNGGSDGSPNFVEVLRPTGEMERYAVASNVLLNQGDVVRVTTGAGGGFGNPLERDPELVAADIENEILDPEWAREAYGYREARN